MSETRTPVLTADMVIIGAGFAGLAAAEALLRNGLKKVVVVEREPTPGQHASGQNAGMIRQAGVDEPIQRVLIEGAKYLREIFKGTPSFQETGSLLLVSGGDRIRLDHYAAASQRLGLEVMKETRAQAIRRVPLLERAEFEEAYWCPSDGVLDIHALLQYLMKRVKDQGGNLHLDWHATGFESSGGRITAVVTDRGTLQADQVVNAAGAWAEEVGRLAGALPIGMKPSRRHLAFTGPLAWANPRWPFVWDVSNAYYFRPETGGLIFSPCDETIQTPGTPQVEMGVFSDLAIRLKKVCPALAEIPIQRAWAGLRTFAEDRMFVVGQDSQVKNFYWLAGQGGHGVTGCLALGNLVARVIAGHASLEETALWNPGRFKKK